MTDNNREMRMAVAIADVTDTWVAVYDRLVASKCVQDEAARVRAANGILVSIERSVGFRFPENAGYTTADKLPTPKPGQNALDTMPTPFDAANHKWRYCPDCHTTEINQQSKSTGKDYQACFRCHQLLQREGTKVPMRGGGGA
jgi:hypothetical protein